MRIGQQLRAILAAIRPQYVIAAAAAGLIIIDTFVKNLTLVSLGLVVVALSPWILKYIRIIELPGGAKVHLHEQLEAATEKAEKAGLLTAPEQAQEGQQSLLVNLFKDDPTLALAGLRIELERRLRALAAAFPNEVGDNPNRPMPLGLLVRQLVLTGALTQQESSAISDLLPLLNRAVHAQDFNEEAASWAIDFGPRLLASLDAKIHSAQRLGDQ